MHLTLSPTRGLPDAAETQLSVVGDVITVDRVAFDFSHLAEGGVADAEGGDHPFTGRITRREGVIHATVRVVLDGTACPDQPGDPAHWIIPEAEGPVTIPAVRLPAPEAEAGIDDE
jgi:hypothetical protein